MSTQRVITARMPKHIRFARDRMRERGRETERREEEGSREKKGGEQRRGKGKKKKALLF